MTFLVPSCPLGETIISNMKETITQQHPNINVVIDVVYHPQWTTSLIIAEGKKILGL